VRVGRKATGLAGEASKLPIVGFIGFLDSRVVEVNGWLGFSIFGVTLLALLALSLVRQYPNVV